jgi:hypothetical protein
MRGADRIILVVLPLIALAAGFWFLVLSPKQKEAGELQDQITALEAEVSDAEAAIAEAEQAQRAFPDNYSDLVKLGTAVPEDGDQATLIYDMTQLGRENEVSFRSFEVTSDGAAAEPPPAPAPTEPAEPSATDAEGEETTVAAPATEASAAVLPIGAAVGPAGLPITPYKFAYTGDFFDMADFFGDLDRRVSVPDVAGEPDVRGRLMTVDGFAFSADPINGFPRVEANFNVTTYVVPPEQGIAAGATPQGPPAVPPAGAPTTVEASSTPAAGTTAAVTP